MAQHDDHGKHDTTDRATPRLNLLGVVLYSRDGAVLRNAALMQFKSFSSRPLPQVPGLFSLRGGSIGMASAARRSTPAAGRW